MHVKSGSEKKHNTPKIHGMKGKERGEKPQQEENLQVYVPSSNVLRTHSIR